MDIDRPVSNKQNDINPNNQILQLQQENDDYTKVHIILLLKEMNQNSIYKFILVVGSKFSTKG